MANPETRGFRGPGAALAIPAVKTQEAFVLDAAGRLAGRADLPHAKSSAGLVEFPVTAAAGASPAARAPVGRRAERAPRAEAARHVTGRWDRPARMAFPDPMEPSRSLEILRSSDSSLPAAPMEVLAQPVKGAVEAAAVEV